MILTLVYLGGVMLAVYPIYTALLADAFTVDRSERFFCGTMAVLAAPFWPAALLGWLTFRLSRSVWRRVVPDNEKERSA